MPKEASPEERFLRLMRSKSGKQDGPQPDIEGEDSRPKADIDNTDAVVKGILGNAPDAAVQAGSKHSIQRLEPSLNSRNLSLPPILRYDAVNLVLTVALVVLIAYAVPVFLKRPKGTAEFGNVNEKQKTREKTSGQKELIRPDLNYFSGQIEARNIFSPAATEESSTAQGPIEQGPSLEEVKSQLNLLGVMMGDTPQAIIEDKKTQRSYFLNKGGSFDDIQVKAISENKVILTYKGQEFELTI